MLCTVCRESLEGIWDPTKTRRVCHINDFNEGTEETDMIGHVPLPPMPDEHPSQYMLAHHLTLESYEQSVTSGCVVCCCSSREGHEVNKRSVFSRLGYYSLFTIFLPRGYPVMRIYTPRSAVVYPMGLLNGSPKDYNHNIGQSMGDSMTWSLIQDWVNTCIHTHLRCNQVVTSYIPSYLLQLGDDNEHFQLVSADQVDHSTIRYCTLSHCHATSGANLQLTTSTLEGLSSPQPLSTLALTYKDAFTVVKRLGLRHLWIDHLCILQDGPTPSDNEIQSIFSNSFCGIGATASTSPSSGLFSQRNVELVKPTVFEFPLNVEGQKSLVGFRGGDIVRFQDEPLVLSAKGFRERLLTPRMIHFGTSLVFWECYGALCNEVNPRGILHGPGGYTNVEGEKPIISGEMIRIPPRPVWKPLILFGPFNCPSGRPQTDIFTRWFLFLVDYTKCSVVTPEERLTCLESAAEGMKALLKDQGCDNTYLAGIWKETLPASLLWFVGPDAKRLVGNKAPSWSWAAVDGYIHYDWARRESINDASLCELVDLNCTADETGLIATTSLTLRGKLAIGKLSFCSDAALIPWFPEWMDVDKLVNPETGANLGNKPDDIAHASCWVAYFDTKQDMGDEAVFLPIGIATFPENNHQAYGIALTRLDGGAYMRCGRWSVSTTSAEETRQIFDTLPEVELRLI